jgi:ribonucleoside-diphosphate reductase alpha chain
MAARANDERRIGLNPYSGLGSALAMLRIPYDSEEALGFVKQLGHLSANTAYIESSKLAIYKGKFEKYDERFCNMVFFDKLDYETQQHVRKHGIRNIALLTVPPVGTGSLIAGNISNGLEPIFSLEYYRKVRQQDGSSIEECVDDYAWRMWKKRYDEKSFNTSVANAPDFFKTSRAISPKAHIDMQAEIQVWIDNSISKTCNLPEETTLEEYQALLMYAIKRGCKGFTTFREGTREGVLSEKKEAKHVEELKVAETKKSRERVLDGKTFQIKDDSKKHTYITINHVEEHGVKKPWEIFLFSKSAHAEWYAAMGVLMSSIMRKVGNVDFVIDDLKEISGDGGYFTQEYGFMGSKPAHIAYILEEYIHNLNGTTAATVMLECPKCKEQSFIKEGGCNKCLSCGHNECG